MKLYLNIVLLLISSLIILQFTVANVRLLRNPAQDFEVNFLAGKQVLKNQNPYLKLAKDIVRITPPTLVVFELFAIFPLATTTFLIHKLKLPIRFFFITAVSYLMIGFNIKNPAAFINLGYLGPLILSHVLFGTVLLLFLNYFLMRRLGQKV